MAKRLLLVDDSPADLHLISSVLSVSGYQISTAANGEEGLAKAKSERPDLIILDVVMPKMNGFQVCRAIKSTSDIAAVPVILLTSKNQKSDQFWGMKQGADMYLTKPFAPNELLKAAAKYLAKHLLLRYEREERRQQRKAATGPLRCPVPHPHENPTEF